VACGEDQSEQLIADPVVELFVALGVGGLLVEFLVVVKMGSLRCMVLWRRA
jgi:hypothetical protein